MTRPTGATVGDAAPAPPEPLNAVLRRLRRQRGLSQRELVRRLHLSAHSSIADFESGRRVPHRDILADYERVFDLPEGALQRLRPASRTAGGPAPAAPPAGAPQPHALPKPAEPPTTGQFPADVPRFFGRWEELLRILDARREQSRAVGIFGAPGVGKTALAVHLVHLTRVRFPEGRVLVDLRGDTAQPMTPSAALTRLLRGLGLAPAEVPGGWEERITLYRSLTATRSLAIVLDNARDEAQIRDLLPLSGDCLVLVTGRRTLYGPGLAETLILREFDQEAACALLLHTAGRPEAPAAAGLAQVAESCGRLPLALTIAGARLAARPTWSVDRLGALLADEERILDHLTSGDRDLRSVLERSYALLPADQRSLLRRAALFGRRPFDVQLAGRLLDASRSQVESVLEQLVDQNLLRADNDSQYRLEGLLHNFALERLQAEESAAQRGQLTQRLLVWLATACAEARRLLLGDHRTAAAGGPTPPAGDHDSAVRWYEAHHSHLVAAVEWAAQRGQPALAVGLCRSLGPLFAARKHWADWIRTHRIGVRCALGAGDHTAAALLLHSLGSAYTEVGLLEQARQCFETALRTLRDCPDSPAGNGPDDPLSGMLFGALGRLALEQDRPEEALSLLRRAVAACRRGGEPRELSFLLVQLGRVESRSGRLAECAAALREADRLARQLGDRYLRADALLALGRAETTLGRGDQAQAALTQAIALRRELGDRYGESLALAALADCHRDARRFPEAFESLDAAHQLRREYDRRYVEGNRWIGPPPVDPPSGPRLARDPGAESDRLDLPIGA